MQRLLFSDRAGLADVGLSKDRAAALVLSQMTSRQLDRLSRKLQGRGEGFNRSRVAALVKPPKGQDVSTFDDQSSSIRSFSENFHQILFRNKIPSSIEMDGVAKAEAHPDADLSFWIQPAGSEKRSEVLRKQLSSRPELKPWLLYELLERKKSSEFIQLAHASPVGPVDAAPYWDRLLFNRKTQILQDPCLRMIDLKIFEGGGAKTCDSPALIALQDWLRQNEQASDENHQREARGRTLRTFHELRNIRRIHLINRALGQPLELPAEVGGEILRTEMALRLPELQSIKIAIDQSELSMVDTTD